MNASCLRSAALLQALDTAICSCHVLPQPWASHGIACYLCCALLSLEVWAVLSLTFHCDSGVVFSNVKLALRSVATAVNPQKMRYTAKAVRAVEWHNGALHSLHNSPLNFEAIYATVLNDCNCTW